MFYFRKESGCNLNDHIQKQISFFLEYVNNRMEEVEDLNTHINRVRLREKVTEGEKDS